MAGKIETKLAELGVTLPEAPVPAANYVPYVLTGNQVYVSGQISQGPEGLITGKLGSGLDVAAGAAAARAIPSRAPARTKVHRQASPLAARAVRAVKAAMSLQPTPAPSRRLATGRMGSPRRP